MFLSKCSLFHQPIFRVLLMLTTLIFLFSYGVFGAAARKLDPQTLTSFERLTPNVPNNHVNKNGHGERFNPLFLPRNSSVGDNGAIKNYFSRTITSELPANSSPSGAASFNNAALSQAYNKSDYYYNNNNNKGYSSLFNEHQNRQPYKLDISAPIPQMSGINSYSPAKQIHVQTQYNSASGLYPNELQYFSAQSHQELRRHEDEENSSFEIEDKVFSKTVVATKALKVGKIVFTFFMVLIVLILAGLGKLGLTVSPVVLPLALLPIGIIALLLFIPLFILFVPLAATGAIGERRKRRRRRNADPFTTIVKAPINIMEEFLQEQLPNILDKIEVSMWDWEP